jgi:GNAT superfamily N-acetyltransferase
MTARDTTAGSLEAASQAPMDLTALARAETRRLMLGCAAVAQQTEPLGGGLLLASEPGTWCNFACGVGLGRAFSDADLARLESFYTERGLEPRIETSPYMHSQALAQLAERAWVVRRFETVLYRPLHAGEAFEPIVRSPRGMRIEIVQPHDDATLHAWASVQCEGFMPPGSGPRPEDIALAKRTIDHRTSFAFLATMDGQPAAAGACEVRSESAGQMQTDAAIPIAALFGLSTRERFRRQGLQQALIAARLAFARQRGAIVATIGGSPGAGTERNVRRMGFEVAYTMTVLVKPAAGLVSAG